MSKKRKSKRKRHAPGSQSPAERRRQDQPPSRDERVLGERLNKFSFQEDFLDDFEDGILAFFGEQARQGDELVFDERQIPAFQEWYVHDYVTLKGASMLDLFAEEMGPRLPAAQQQLLDEWRRTNHYRLVEVQAVEVGIGLTVRDLLDGEVLEVSSVAASYDLLKWEIALARLVLSRGYVRVSGETISFAPRYRAEIETYARQLWDEYRERDPQASPAGFYRCHALDLRSHVLGIANRLPSLYAPEGHPILFSEALYTVKDSDAVFECLDEAEEFKFTGSDEEEGVVVFGWIAGGRSRVPQAPAMSKDGAIMQGSLTPVDPDADEESIPTLGDVRLWRDFMELHCISRERLEAGKRLLRQVLGRLVRHEGDEFTEVADVMEASDFVEGSDDATPEPLSQAERAVAQRLADELLEKWPDQSIPGLDGKTPRDAARDPAMRERLEEMLKTVEYMEEKKRRAGAPYVDIADLRRELGLGENQ